MVSLEFFIDIILPIALWPWGRDSASNRNEYQQYFLGVKGGRCVRLTTYHHPVPLSRNLGTLTSWNPLGSSGPLAELFLLLRVLTYIYGRRNDSELKWNILLWRTFMQYLGSSASAGDWVFWFTWGFECLSKWFHKYGLASYRSAHLSDNQ